MNSKYEDIIDRSPPAPVHRAPMSMEERAAQFSSFAALTGYEEVIAETGRVTQACPQLTADTLEELDRALRLLLSNPQQSAHITWFCPDKSKAGGSIRSVEGTVLSYKPASKTLWLSQGIHLSLEHILAIELL